MSGSNSLPEMPTTAWVDQDGIHAPPFAIIQAYLVGQMQAIYGQDIVVTPDSQDGQIIGIFSLAISDCNSMAISVYNGFSPNTAIGVGLSSMVKINGMARALPSQSSVQLLLVGQAGTFIEAGVAGDGSNNRWLLPPNVIIPPGGEITVTATAEQPGAIPALPHTITRILTVTRGWQTVDNPTAAARGAPLETDAALRRRQSFSTALPSQSVLSGIVGAVLGLFGVTACSHYENDTSTDYTATPPPSGVGPLPPHSIGLVVEGGDATEICQTILLNKTPGCYTAGTTRVTVNDVYGLPHDIGFYIPSPVPIGVHITLRALAGYSTLVGQAISQTVADFITTLGAGTDVIYSKLWLPANLCDASGAPTGASGTYDITAMTVGKIGDTYATANIPIAIFEKAGCLPADVVITVA